MKNIIALLLNKFISFIEPTIAFPYLTVCKKCGVMKPAIYMHREMEGYVCEVCPRDL